MKQTKYEASLIDIDCQQTDTVDKGAGSETDAAREKEKESEGALNNAA